MAFQKAVKQLKDLASDPSNKMRVGGKLYISKAFQIATALLEKDPEISHITTQQYEVTTDPIEATELVDAKYYTQDCMVSSAKQPTDSSTHHPSTDHPSTDLQPNRHFLVYFYRPFLTFNSIFNALSTKVSLVLRSTWFSARSGGI